MEQRARGTLQVWAEPFVSLRLPKIYNIRLDPYERADVTSNTYYDWLLDQRFCSFLPRTTSENSWRRSRNSRLGKKRPALTWTK